MRTFRLMAAGLAALLASAHVASAQAARPFENSWFWGAKGGISSFSTTTVHGKVAPLVGGEWLITRKRFGLYVGADQTFFEETSALVDGTGAMHEVGIKNLRRLSVAGLAFPKAYGSLRPYGGIGIAMNLITQVGIPDDFDNDNDASFAAFVIEEQKDRASFLAMLGAQGEFGRVSPFAQVTYQPSQIGFLINERPMYFLEAGIRYNIGSAIERPE